MTTQPERRPNRLLAETSPYLQQHAYNPVDWYPWGEEALRRSRELDRPIFLSVGYSTCHWCHVMERESFENEEIARLLNESFVSIKVDREERPDIDATYMSAVQMLTGSGGWPMSVFLTPELKPFWGGTYFPPRDLHGRPGFPRILTQIAEVYRTQRERVEESAQEITSHLVEVPAPPSANELPGDEILEAAVDYARRTFDPGHGGFGSAPKFPRSIELSKLLRYHRRTGDEQVLAMVEKTLDGMANGGIHDQIGGGFHRYSTDDRWLVPHFEKMLYDNALLARVYLEGFQATGAPRHAAIARDIFEYVAREMTHPEGAFYSATDADSEGEEGKFFVWTPAQVEEVLGREDARIVCEYLGITREGNFEHGTSIPHVPRPLDVVARLLKLEPGEAVRGIERGIPLLRKARESRIKPFRDEKILAAWNGLMISAFARGAQVLGEPRYLEIAERAAGDLVARLCVGGRLHRIHKDGKTRVPGFLDDLAFVAEAFLDLYETSFRLSHLVRARELADQMLAELWDPVGRAFFFTAQHHEALLSRRKDLLDNATPSGNGVAALVLLRLERLTGAEAYRDRAIELLKSLRPLLERAPMAMSSAILALEFNPPLELALAGDPTSPRGRALLQAAHRQFLPARVVAAALPGEEEAARQAIPLLRGKVPVSGEPALHVCRDFACQAPVTTPEAVTAILQPSR